MAERSRRFQVPFDGRAQGEFREALLHLASRDEPAGGRLVPGPQADGCAGVAVGVHQLVGDHQGLAAGVPEEDVGGLRGFERSLGDRLEQPVAAVTVLRARTSVDDDRCGPVVAAEEGDFAREAGKAAGCIAPERKDAVADQRGAHGETQAALGRSDPHAGSGFGQCVQPGDLRLVVAGHRNLLVAGRGRIGEFRPVRCDDLPRDGQQRAVAAAQTEGLAPGVDVSVGLHAAEHARVVGPDTCRQPFERGVRILDREPYPFRVHIENAVDQPVVRLFAVRLLGQVVVDFVVVALAGLADRNLFQRESVQQFREVAGGDSLAARTFEKELHQAAREVVAEDVVAEEVKRHLFPVLQQCEETLGENERGQPFVVVVAHQFAQLRPSDLRPGAFRRGEIVSRNQVVDIVDTEQQGVGVLRQIVVAALPLRVGFPPLRDIAVKQFLGVFFQVPEKQRKELPNPQRRAGAEQHQVEVARVQETVEQPDVGAVVDQRPVERRRLYGILGQLHAEIVGDGQQQGRQPVVREKLPENPFARQDDGVFGQLPDIVVIPFRVGNRMADPVDDHRIEQPRFDQQPRVGIRFVGIGFQAGSHARHEDQVSVDGRF